MFIGTNLGRPEAGGEATSPGTCVAQSARGRAVHRARSSTRYAKNCSWQPHDLPFGCESANALRECSQNRAPHTTQRQLFRERSLHSSRAERIMATPPVTPRAMRVQMKKTPPDELATAAVNPLFR
jgi:hypothetical protein